MGITAGGVGSGLDIESIINGLMSIERQPLQKLQDQKKALDTQVSDLGKLKSQLSALKDASDTIFGKDFFNIGKVNSSDESVAKATIGNSAPAGSYNLQVDRLAKAQVDVFDVTNFTPSSQIIKVAGVNVDLGANYAAMTPQDVVARINATNAIPVTASIVNSTDGSGNPVSKLVLTAKDTGAPAYSSSDFSLGAGASLIAGEGQAGQNAIFRVNGVSVQSKSNIVDDVIPGVSLTLNKENATTVIRVDQDVDAIKKGIQGFVDAYNGVVDMAGQLSGGSFKGDGLIRSIKSELYNQVYNPESGGELAPLISMGIGLGANGKLEFNTKTFDKAFKTDPSVVQKNLALVGGAMSASTKKMLESEGLVGGRQSVLDARIKTNGTQQDAMNIRLDNTEKALRKQYSALDTALAQMQQSLSRMMSMLGR
ncbi:flagellar filament capping protein FliD [Laribacter hongkongensis]|uniref:flagellar filament capping protein FliD n=1 Tax=Laribacter hongkongensis TaxID=168471 RepID=UPI001EFEA1B5|nr:flagellar filament capping protein FliD [Laribacter hongkongensis]MCG8993022.1 flagellar filament capping protein FliD [Laribacter hongkongensis]MCG8998768.1 flagellar filament capping protein FliD [Laribacter hongkongensis]MCG9002122.1 flagellar filament capping protein FliD [Laribacter hongkongensis]MCG9005293.1 flagellar filament capping protein FliD [Laribacter hongkongensis]MCG9007807.1 flagellar filament capping protein FliD [Laribacter hongkongensis]